MEAALTGPEERIESAQCLADDLGWLLGQAKHAFASEVAAALGPLGVSPRGHFVLAAARTGAHTQTELAKLVGLDKTTMVVTIDELEQAGLAERRFSSTDRRARVIAVTDAGGRKVAEARKVIEQVQENVLATLPAATREQFMEALRQLVFGRLNEPVPCNPPLRRREL